MAVVMGLTILIPMGIVIRWFIQQKDWDPTLMAYSDIALEEELRRRSKATTE